MVTPAIRAKVEPSNSELIPSHTNSKGLRLDPTRLLSQGDRKVDFARLESLIGQSVLAAGQFDAKLVVELCKFAALLEVTEIASHHPLDGKLVVTAFFEASTRTRLSFEAAVQRLDGRIVSVPDGRVTGIAKGESLEDIGEMLNTYGDLVVLRHPETSSVARILTNLQIPLVNAGNGSGEHPTQALIDWYTLIKWRPQFILDSCPEDERLHLGIIGTPGSMRAVKSFMHMALLFPANIRKITVVSEMVDPLGSELTQAVEDASVVVEHTNDVREVLPDLDVIYMNSIAFLGDSYRELDARFKLSASSPLKEGAVVMHPFARRGELDSDLDPTSHNLYFAQAASAVFLRQSLLISVLGRIARLPPSLLLLTT
jgi:aspartate carbamoyltransferase catalytic subunit